VPDETLLFLSTRLPKDSLERIRRDLRPPLDKTALETFAAILRDLLKLSFTPELRAVPSLDFALAIEGLSERWHPGIEDTFVFALEPLDSERVAELQDKAHSGKALVSIDLPIAPAHVWSPQQASFPLFAQLDLALAQIRASAAVAKGALGDKVNVVIVDQGINRLVLAKSFPTVKFAGGWAADKYGRGGPPGPPTLVQPGDWPDGHGTKMAEMVLSVAPNATIYDLPLLPSDILDLQTYLAWAAGAYWMLNGVIPWLRLFPPFSGPWIFCNAWAVYDLRDDAPPTSTLNYGNNPNNSLNLAVASLPRNNVADVAFAAGNCGQFFPDPRCLGQIGPGRSIYGVAALADVLSVSAVRGDQIRLGYSSEGPAPAAFASTKPDLSAPSQFAAPNDWSRAYTGTSTACALMTGALAAARSYPATRMLTAAALRARAIATVSPMVQETLPNQNVGAGLLNVDALL
jgi:hypothetical protein